MAEQVLTLRINADGSAAIAAIKQVSDAESKLGDAGKAAGDQAAAGFDKAGAAADQMGVLVGKARDALGNVGGSAQQSSAQVSKGFDQMGSAAQAFMAQGRAVQDLMQSEAKTLADIATRHSAYAAALKNDVISQAEFAAASKALSSQQATLEKMLGNTGNAGKKTADAMGALGVASAGAQREVGVLIGELARGNFAAFEKSLITLSRQTGLLTAAFNVMLGPIGLVIGVVALAVAAFVQLENQQSALGKAIIETGNYAGVTKSQLDGIAQSVGGATGKIGESREALVALTATGKFTGDQLAALTAGVVNFSTVTGESIDKSVAAFVRLAEDPVQASVKLNEQYHYLTLAIFEQIEAAEKIGDTQRAAAIAEGALADAFAGRAEKIQANLGIVERAWQAVKKAAAGAWDAILDIGRPDAPDQALKDATAAKNAANNKLNDFIAAGAPQSYIDNLAKELQAASDAEGALLQASIAAKGATDSNAAAMEGLEKQTQAAGIAGQASFDKLTASLDKTAASQQKITLAAHDLYAIYQAGGKLPAGISFDGPVADVPVGPGWEKLKAEIVGVKAQYKDLGAVADDAMKRQLDQADKLTAALGDPFQAAWAKYDEAVRQANDLANKSLIAGNDLNTVLAVQQQAIAAATDARDKSIQKALEEGDVSAKIIAKIEDENQALLDSVDGHTKLKEIIQAEAAAREAYQRGQRASPDLYQSEVDGIRHAVVQHNQLDLAIKQNMEVQKAWQNVWVQGFDSFGNGLAKVGADALLHFKSIGQTFKDLGKVLTDTASQIVQQIISYFLKLAVINPILNSIFGGQGASWSPLATLANVGGSGPNLVDTGAKLMSGGLSGQNATDPDFMSGGALSGTSSGFDISSPSTWLSAGKTLFAGFNDGFASLWSGNSAYAMGPPTADGVMPGATGGYGSALSQGIGIAGAAYAGVSEFKNAGGGVAGVTGGLTYAAGTYALGAGVASALAGTGFAAGVTGAFAAVPVVGWVAIGAMLLDKLTGGKLFGTAWSATGQSQSTISIDQDGGSVLNQHQESKQKAFFGGTKYKDVTDPTTADQQTMVDALYIQQKTVAKAAATALGGTVTDIITGSFNQVMDKSGKITQQTSTVLGKVYTEAFDKFQERLQAENVIAQVDQNGGGGQASKIADQYRADADQLADAAQFLLAAQVDIHKGISLLGDNTSLADINTVVGQLQQSGETLVQTYQRLQVETQNLKSALDVMGLNVGKTGADFVKFADDASTAAGGADKLVSLLTAYQSAYYSADQIAQGQIAAYQKQSDAALAALGLSASTTMEEYNKQFQAALPTLTGAQLEQWLQAGVYLAQATKAQNDYNDTLKQNADTVKSILDSLAPAGTTKAATDPYGAAIDQVNANFDAAIAKMKAAGATDAQIAEAEADRQLALQSVADTTKATYQSLVDQITQSMADFEHPQTSLQKSLDAVTAAEKATEDQLNAAAKAAGMAGASEEDLAKARKYAAEQTEAIKAAAQSQVNGILAGLAPDAGAKTWENTIAGINSQFDDAIAKMKDYGATADQIATAEYDRAQAIASAKKDAESNYASLVDGVAAAFGELSHPSSDFQKKLQDIAKAEADTTKQLNDAAKAAGMQGAREQDLALVHQYAAAQAAAAAHELELASKDLVSQLYGGGAQAIATQSSAVTDGLQTVADGIGAIGDAADKFKKSMLLDTSLSPLNQQAQLDEAIKQLRVDGSAQTAQTALQIGRGLMASGDDYTKLFDMVTGLVRNDGSQSSGSGGGGGRGGGASSEALSPLQRNQMAQQLAQNLADLSGFKGEDFASVAKDLGFNLGQLGQDLGLQGDALTKYLDSLKSKSYSLDDLGKMVSDQVDRIIAAINGSSASAAAEATKIAPPNVALPERGEHAHDAVTDPDHRVAVPIHAGQPPGVIVGPQPVIPVGAATTSPGAPATIPVSDPATTAVGEKVDALRVDLASLMTALAKVIASSASDTETATKGLAPMLESIERNTRSINSGTGQRSERLGARVLT